jgi:uncharacterized protein YfaS (alpha-2-macroglobulin family)
MSSVMRIWIIVFQAFALALLVLSPTLTLAQGAIVPERRLAVTQNMDFYGADLQPIFETSFENCEKSCLADQNCKAFTFNIKANACFPKSSTSEMKPFDGAISAWVLDTDPRVLAGQAQRQAALSFMPDFMLKEAARQSRRLARDYLTNQWTADQLTEASRNASDAGNHVNAVRFMGAALNLTDDASGWGEMALLALEQEKKNQADRSKMQQIATSAAINAYMRSDSHGMDATSLLILSKALEERGYGRTSIPVLRLAQETAQPRRDIDDALDRAIGLYGFRIVEHSVENNAELPRVCVEFNEALVQAGVEYSDYVRLPKRDTAVEVDGTKLCMTGMTHGERARLTFREGLPALSGEKLVKSIDIDIYIKDRDPVARFTGKEYILPKGEHATIPIITTNLSEVELKIHRVGDRNLVRTIQQGYFNRPVSTWGEQALRDDLGEQVWSGKGIVAMEVNKDVTTALPIGDAISKFEPGVYVLSARVEGSDPYDSSAAQWFVVTDLGLASMTGGDGLHVFARSLNSADALGGVKLQLIATNNNILGEAVTDAAGYARFAPGLLKGANGAEPALISATSADEDFAFLNLKEAAFDLSDRGVKGNVSPPPIDVFLTTERGAYRTGETVYATALTRDGRAEAIEHLPLTAIITRPDGIEFSRELLDDQGAGGRVFAVHLPESAQRGTWNIRVHANVDETALASQKFLVEDLIPDRIEFDLTMADTPVHLEDVPKVMVDARYLYGAPGADLEIEAEVRVSAATGLDGYAGYLFGDQSGGFSTQVEYTQVNVPTDRDGKAEIALAMPNIGQVARPLKMLALVRLKEGSGRPVERAIERVLAPSETVIGIKPLFDGVVAEGDLARFDVLAVDPNLDQTSLPKAQWVLNRINTRYQWYRSYGNWDYERVETRTRVANGSLSISDTGAVRIETPVDWGQYELMIETVDGDYKSAATRFYAGWYAPADTGTTPDTLEIGLDKDGYRIGDTARLRVVPRYAGTALVTVMSNRLIAMKSVAVAEGENLIDLDVTEDWGAGAYVTATVIRPMNVAAGRNPARALGLGWASVDPGDHRLGAVLTADDEVAPRGPVTVGLDVSNIRPGETAYAVIAAVDVGILNITGFTPPDPDDHYFGQRKLGMEMRDLYGRLIDGTQGAMGQIRSGGDGPLPDRMSSPPPNEDLVTFFSGPIEVGADGTAEVTFDIPDFNGTLRVMSVVWSKTGVGQASTDVLIRDPIVLTASLPRFLAPYDESRVLLEIAHATGPSGDVKIDLRATEGLYIDRSGVPGSVTLAELGRQTLSIPITAPASGTPEITVRLTTPDGKVLDKTLKLPIRANDPEVARTVRVDLRDGDTFTLNSEVFAGYLPGTGRATLAVGPLARFDAPGLLSALDRYPYGCTEQITSKALPLLYFEPVANAMGLSQTRNISTRIEQAIGEVLSNQSSNGGFGLWSPGSGDLWLDSYVSDFLSRARAKGFAVPQQAFRLAMDNLRNRVNYAPDFENGGQDIAYALMVLAREGAANIGDLRYFADAKADNFGSPLALAQLGAALASYGDQIRADRMFRKAGERLDVAVAQAEQQVWRVDYGTNLRDSAAILALAVEAGSEVLDQATLARRITPEDTVNRFRSTQENMWSLMAANALIEDMSPDDFLINGQPAGGPLVRVLDAQTGYDRTVEVLNQSGKTATTVLTTFGIPSDPEPAGGNGYSIDRFYFTLDGKPVTPRNVALNERLVVLVKVTPQGSREARLIVDDPLPAGFEIDNPSIVKSGDVKALDWLKLNANPQMTEFRSARFIAAVDWSANEAFQLAYIVRAISPGRFHHPAASVEDMYRPQYRARTGVGVVEVSAD